jgi:signal transduction histidine kinase
MRVSTERLAALACRLSSASVAESSWLPVADVAVRQLAELVPEGGAAVATRLRASGYLRAISVANLPFWTLGHPLPATTVPLLVKALANPDRIVDGRDLAAIGVEHAPAAKMRLVCGAVPARGPSLMAVLLVVPAHRARRRDLAHAVDVVRSLLAVAAEPPAVKAASSPTRDPVFRAIRRAKREWEDTADALPAVLGLLGADGRVMRVNRAIERIVGLPVERARGRTLHDSLHPACSDGGACPLATALDAAWSDVLSKGAVEFEVEDPATAVDWHVHLLRTTTRSRASDRAGVSRAAFAVTDATHVRRTRRLLQDAKQTLESRVSERTQALMRTNGALHEEVERRLAAEASLRKSRNELQLLTDRRVQLQEEERQRIASDLHDSVGQSLSAIKYSLERALEQLSRPALGPVKPVIEKAIAGVQHVVDDVRTISMNLHPSVLDDLGAASAISWFCREWGSTYTGVRVVARVEVRDADIPRALGLTVFRTIQEALNNVAKHARATSVEVRVRLVDDSLVVRVRDNGCGFQTGPLCRGEKPSHGLRGMRERAEREGGHFQLRSTPGGGTTVEIGWPVAPPPAETEETKCVN